MNGNPKHRTLLIAIFLIAGVASLMLSCAPSGGDEEFAGGGAQLTESPAEEPPPDITVTEPPPEEPPPDTTVTEPPPSLSISPDSRGDHGEVKVGQIENRAFTLSYSGTNSAANITASIPTDSFFFWGGSSSPKGAYPGASGTCGDTIVPDSSCKIIVSFWPKSVGSFEDVLTISYLDGSDQRTTTANLQGTGIPLTIYAATGWWGLSISKDGGENFVHKREANSGLGSNTVNGVYVDGRDFIYAATANGLSISTDGGESFENRTMANGLGSNIVNGVHVNESNGDTFVATENGLFIAWDAYDSGRFENKTMATVTGLKSNTVYGVYVNSRNGVIYAATAGGLSISNNKAGSFVTSTMDDGLGNNDVRGVYVNDYTGYSYAATAGGLSIYTRQWASDTAAQFENKRISDGLGSNNVKGVYRDSNGIIYAATTNGLSILKVGGERFENKITDVGPVNGVYVK